MSYRILVVDDEADILEFVSYNLRKEGFEPYTANNGHDAIKIAQEKRPHLILLDVMMPDIDGIETCKAIRACPEMDDVMIAFLSARSAEETQIAGFDAGADNYISKPIKIEVLLSIIKAMLKRIDGDQIDNANRSIKIDKTRHLIIKDGEELVLPRKEFNLLSLLYSKPQKVFTREEIYSAVWGDDVIVGDRTIDVHIRKVREKIGDKHITTIKGVGYKYED